MNSKFITSCHAFKDSILTKKHLKACRMVVECIKHNFLRYYKKTKPSINFLVPQTH